MSDTWKCPHCGFDRMHLNQYCARCGLWPDHTYTTTSDDTTMWPVLSEEDWQGLERGRPVHCTGVDGDQFIGFAHAPDAEGEGVLIEGGTWTASIFEAENVRRLIAVANDALPKNDPGKITWELVEALQSVARQNPDSLPGYGVPLHRLAAALASYLPPKV